MIVDFHTHTFPDAIARTTVEKLAAAAHIPAFTDGTEAGLTASMAGAGIDRAVVLPVATNPLKVNRLNDHAAAMNGRNGVYHLGAMHPACPYMKEELRRIKALGLRGIKIHPVYQNEDIDAKPFLELLTLAAENGLFVVTHAGDDIGFPGVRRAAPAQIANALRQIGDVPLILAHSGGWKNWEDVPALAGSPSVMIDISFSLGEIADAGGYYTQPERRLLSGQALTDLIRAFGAQRVLFGTDSPWTDQKQSLEAFRRLDLTARERALIEGENALRLLEK